MVAILFVNLHHNGEGIVERFPSSSREEYRVILPTERGSYFGWIV